MDQTDEVTQRLGVVERDIAAIKIDVAVIKSDYATKADVAQAKTSVIIWVVSAIFLAQLLPGPLTRPGWGP